MGPHEIEMDALNTAIAETEKEIFGEAFGKEETTLDSTGDRSLEMMGEGLEGQHEPEDDDEDETSEGADTGKENTGEEPAKGEQPEGKKPDEQEQQAQRQQPEGRVPPGRLREANDARRAAEAERDAFKAQIEQERANSRKESETLNARLAALEQLLQRQQTPAPKVEQPAPEVVPDIFEDPKAYSDYLMRQHQTELAKRDQAMQQFRVETSMQLAHVKHGDEFSNAFEAVKKLDPRDQDAQATVQRIYASPNPGEALVQWHKRNEVLRTVGNDPAKYREQIAEETRKSLMNDPEFRRQLIDELRADAMAGDNGQPRTITRLPKSLSNAPGNSSVRSGDASLHDNSDRSVFDSAFR